MGRGMQETNERSRQESGNAESIVPSPRKVLRGVGWDGMSDGGGRDGGSRCEDGVCVKSLT